MQIRARRVRLVHGNVGHISETSQSAATSPLTLASLAQEGGEALLRPAARTGALSVDGGVLD